MVRRRVPPSREVLYWRLRPGRLNLEGLLYQEKDKQENLHWWPDQGSPFRDSIGDLLIDTLRYQVKSVKSSEKLLWEMFVSLFVV